MVIKIKKPFHMAFLRGKLPGGKRGNSGMVFTRTGSAIAQAE